MRYTGGPATTFCVPEGAATTIVAAADRAAYARCKWLFNPGAACQATIDSYESGTGCGAECQQGRRISNDRTTKFCASTPKRNCATVVAPCDPDAGGMDPADGPVGPLPDVSKKEEDSNAAAIAGGVAGGLIALAAMAIAVLWLVRRKRAAQRSSAGALEHEDGHPFSHHGKLQHDHGLDGGSGYGTGPHSASGWGPPVSHHGQYGSGSVPHSDGFATGPSGHSALRHGSSYYGNSASEHSFESYGHGHAPASRVKVTFLPGRNTFDVTTASSWGPTLGGASAASSISATSSPQQVLDAQLDFIESAQHGMLNRTIRCASLVSQSDTERSLSLLACKVMLHCHRHARAPVPALHAY